MRSAARRSLVARNVPVLLVLLALAGLVGAGLLLPGSPTVAAREGAPLQNDAASGQDAGDSPQVALLLPGARRMWSGNLTPPGTDSDWYRLDASGAFCAVAEATSSATGNLVLAADPSRAVSVADTAEAQRSTRLALAAPAGHAPFLGLEPAMLAAFAGDGSAHPSPGRYAFSLEARSHAELDPEQDGEAPEAGATPATAAPLPPGCTAGRLRGSAGDVEDRYVFDVSGSARISLSFALAGGDAARARVLTPSGATHATLASGDALTVWADEPGRWTVVVEPEATAAQPTLALGLALATEVPESSYLLGVVGPPDPEPCRPSCLG